MGPKPPPFWSTPWPNLLQSSATRSFNSLTRCPTAAVSDNVPNNHRVGKHVLASATQKVGGEAAAPPPIWVLANHRNNRTLPYQCLGRQVEMIRLTPAATKRTEFTDTIIARVVAASQSAQSAEASLPSDESPTVSGKWTRHRHAKWSNFLLCGG